MSCHSLLSIWASYSFDIFEPCRKTNLNPMVVRKVECEPGSLLISLVSASQFSVECQSIVTVTAVSLAGTKTFIKNDFGAVATWKTATTKELLLFLKRPEQILAIQLKHSSLRPREQLVVFYIKSFQLINYCLLSKAHYTIIWFFEGFWPQLLNNFVYICLKNQVVFYTTVLFRQVRFWLEMLPISPGTRLFHGVH